METMKRAVLIVILLLAIVAGGFCYYYYSQATLVSVEVADVSIAEVGPEGVTIAIELEVNNPGAFSINFPATSFDTYVDDVYAGPGSSEPTTIPSGARRTVHAYQYVEWQKFPGLFDALLDPSPDEVSISGVAYVKALFFTVEVPFSGTVNVTYPPPPSPLPPAPEIVVVRKITLEECLFTDAPGLILYVKNIGIEDAELAAVYVWNATHSYYADIYPRIILLPGELKELTLELADVGAWTPGCVYSIRVVGIGVMEEGDFRA